jgi:paxillin
MITNRYVNCIIINGVDHFVHHVKNQLGSCFLLFISILQNLIFSGRCITAMGRKYHIEHFICSYCTRQLQNGTFKEYQNKPYCHPCFVKLFA